MATPTLTLADCRAFIPHFHHGILTTGLFAPLRSFRGTPAMEAAAASLHAAFADGRTFPAMSPRFPAPVEELLLLGNERSQLDLALADLSAACAAATGDDDWLDDVARRTDAFRARPTNAAMCDTCFERDLVQVFRRAAVEGADEVLLAYDADGRLAQRYLAAKPVRVTVPAHPMLYASIRRMLERAADAGTLPLTTRPGDLASPAPGRIATPSRSTAARWS
jgi:hypothetical protein